MPVVVYRSTKNCWRTVYWRIPSFAAVRARSPERSVNVGRRGAVCLPKDIHIVSGSRNPRLATVATGWRIRIENRWSRPSRSVVVGSFKVDTVSHYVGTASGSDNLCLAALRGIDFQGCTPDLPIICTRSDYDASATVVIGTAGLLIPGDIDIAPRRSDRWTYALVCAELGYLEAQSVVRANCDEYLKHTGNNLRPGGIHVTTGGVRNSVYITGY